MSKSIEDGLMLDYFVPFMLVLIVVTLVVGVYLIKKNLAHSIHLKANVTEKKSG